MSDRRQENQPVAVSASRTKQVGEAEVAIRQKWAWVEPAVWTLRMLTALEQGVRGGQWFSLIDKVYALPNLRAAFAKVAANDGAAGVDHQTCAQFATDLATNLTRLAAQLRDGSYRPQAVRRVWIPKPGTREKRPLGIPTVRDRVVQAALRAVLEPLFERGFAAHSYGFRPGRSALDAVGRVEELLKAGYTFVVDADLQSYFDTIPHAPLLERVRTQVADGRVLQLVQALLEQGVLSEQGVSEPEAGTPQGAVLSPLLSNLYLDPLDHLIAQRGWEMVRYADDFVILCRTASAAQAALACVQQWTADAGLRLHPAKTRVVDAQQCGGFDFLGYHFERGYKWPRKKSEEKLKERLRELTPRTSGQSLCVIVQQVNQTLSGWWGYFKHSHPTTFPRLDRWLRMRLRSILRKRHGRQGHGRGRDHFRWPNRYFDKLGLFKLTTAQAQFGQSSQR